MAGTLEAGIVLVHCADGKVVGGGVLVGSEAVLTCAHVVARALGRSDDQQPPADAEVRLDFSVGRSRAAVAAEARTEVRAAYLVPAGTLVRAWPSIADQARPPCPYRGLFAFREQDAALFSAARNPAASYLRS